MVFSTVVLEYQQLGRIRNPQFVKRIFGPVEKRHPKTAMRFDRTVVVNGKGAEMGNFRDYTPPLQSGFLQSSPSLWWTYSVTD